MSSPPSALPSPPDALPSPPGALRAPPAVPPGTRRVLMFALLLATTFAGLVWRKRVGMHFGWFAWKYGGSALWAAAVYWLLGALLPRASTRVLAVLAAAVALGVEFSRMVHTPALDAWRLTTAGRLLVGRVFSLRNLPAYWLGVALAAFADDRWVLPFRSDDDRE